MPAQSPPPPNQTGKMCKKKIQYAKSADYAKKSVKVLRLCKKCKCATGILPPLAQTLEIFGKHKNNPKKWGLGSGSFFSWGGHFLGPRSGVSRVKNRPGPQRTPSCSCPPPPGTCGNPTPGGEYNEASKQYRRWAKAQRAHHPHRRHALL